jgi:hypothetical protein
VSSLSIEQRRAIDLAKELLVPKAEELLEKAGVVKLKPKDFGNSQLRNLTAVAMETESPKVVVNFIRYQIGRDNKEKDWRSQKGNDKLTLGERFINEIEGGVIDQALEGIPGAKGSKPHEQLARIELIRHFLGFATRYLKYLDLQRDNGGQS